MRVFTMLIMIIMLGVAGAMGTLKLFEVNHFTSQDYTFIMLCGILVLAILNSFGVKTTHGKDN